jgi:hypothetical protein
MDLLTAGAEKDSDFSGTFSLAILHMPFCKMPFSHFTHLINRALT